MLRIFKRKNKRIRFIIEFEPQIGIDIYDKEEVLAYYGEELPFLFKHEIKVDSKYSYDVKIIEK